MSGFLILLSIAIPYTIIFVTLRASGMEWKEIINSMID